MEVIKSISLFLLAGLCEIGGGYLVWLWLREQRPFWVGLVGAAMLVAYGCVATLQENNFARVYATYGGVFIAMSLGWSATIEGYKPDKFDILGACIALVGVGIIFYAPRE